MEDLNRELNTYLEEASIAKELDDYSGTRKMATDIRKSYLPSQENPNKRTMPKDYNPQGDLFLGKAAGAPVKPSFTETNYNVADAYARTNLGGYIPKYESYQVGRDNAEYAAQTQSTSDKWKNGLTKFAGQVGTGLIGGTVGAVNGIIEGVKQGSFRATYDNQFNDYLDNLNEKWDYQLPNYYSQQEKDAGFVDSLGSANFWAKDVLGGAAFTISAIGSELIWDWATGGAAAATSAARWGNKTQKWLNSTSKLDDLGEGLFGSMSKAKSLTVEPVVKTYMNAKLPTKLATAFGKAGEFANTARFTYTSAGFESGVEARHYIREQEAMFEQDFEAKNGRPATEEDKQAFQTDLTKAANSLYGFNMAVVGSSNLATIGRIFDFKNPLTAGTKWTNSKLFGVGVQDVEGKIAAQIATKSQKVGQYAWSLARSPLIEGVWEEGMQSVGSNTAKHWIESTYDPKYLKNTLDISEAFSQGLSDTYGTKEGMKEVGIGMLIGLLTGSGINLAQGKGFNAEFKGAQKEAKNVETFYNSMYSPQKLSQTLAYSGRLQLANQNADDSSVKGDFTGAELSRQSAIIAQVAQAHNLEYLDEVTKQTKVGIQNIGNDVLMKEYGVDEQGAEELKQKMAQEYEQTAQIYKKNRDYTEYMLNNKLSKQEQEELGKTTADQVKDAVAYELTLGEKVHGFSQDLLTSIKKEIGNNFSGQQIEINEALTIENILLKAGTETRKKAEEHESKARRLEAKRVKLENQYKEIENTLFNLVEPEARKRFLTKADNLRNKITQIEQEKESLTQQYKILLDTANLENPFGNQVEDLFVSSTTLESREQKLADIQGLVGQYKNIDPAKATKLDKMLKEYGKSIYAFKRYADLARQLSDPKLRLRGKRNIITELRSDKTPSEVTVEFLKGVLEGAEQRTADLGSAEERLADMFAESSDVKSVLDEIESEEEVIEPEDDNAIKPPTEEKKEEARQKEIDEIEKEIQYKKEQTLEEDVEEQEKKLKEIDEERLKRVNEVNKKYDRAEAKRISSTSEDIQNYVKELIKNSPYLLEYYGQEVAPTEPTQEEIQEFEELAQMVMSDPKISNKTISFRNPYIKKRPGKLTMSEIQVKRLQALNEKLANWRLLEVYGNNTGLSVADMLMQDIATKQTVEQKPQGTTDVSDNELQNLVDRNPAKTDEGADIRNGEVLQTYENVYVSDTAKGIEISHLSLSGLLSRITGGFTINYEETQTQKNKQELIVSTQDNISLTQAQTLSKPGAKYTVRFTDGTTAVIRIQKGGRLQFKSRDDFNNALKKAELEAKDVKLTNKGGYSPMHDLRTNSRLVTDYQDADSYSPSQLYDMLPGEPVLFRVDMTNPWNIEKWSEYQKGVEALEKGTKGVKNQEQLDRELADTIKIYVTDYNGINMNDLKANYDIQDNPQFLIVRQQALLAAKELMETGRKEMELPLQSQISVVLLGDPNIQFDPTTGKIKFSPLVPQRVETYGYMEKGKLVLKNGVKPTNVRKDYVKRLEGKAGKVPVIVFRQGKYLVAFPVALIRTEANIGDEFFDRILQNKDNKDLSAYAIELNQLLLDNGISPSKHNLYFLDKNNQTLFDENGRSTQNLIAAIDELNKIKSEAKPEDWLKPEHTLSQLETEVTVPVDMTNVVLNSPKPVIDLSPTGLQAIDTNKLTDAKANDIVSKFLNKETLTQSEYDELDNPKVTELLKVAIKADPSLREFIEKAVGKLGNC